MAYTVAEFRKMVRRGDVTAHAKCTDCHIPLQETITGNRWTARGHVCSDCYFKDLGCELDEHPISALRVSRGG